ncbi:sensor histidine kinase [Legionella busanensis]|uniref:diguanylate cyclase n=1 Tax=Legionella busanensis TaxID=190655 RepID=A0A378JKI7_9GAMM|nr:diguanylate cyclase [Legionella busanensis]STX51846.1 sensor histidine kinase [Legionella busanensis]
MDRDEVREKLKKFHLSKPLLNSIFIAALLLFTVLTIYFYQQIKDLINANKWVTHTYQVIQKIDLILYKTVALESDQRGFLLTGNERFVEDVDVVKQDLNNALQEVKILTQDNPEQNQRVIRFTNLINTRIAIIQKIIQSKRLNKFNTPEGAQLLMDGQDTSLRLRGLGQEIKAVEKVLLEERHSDAIRHIDTTNKASIFGNFISILSLVIALILINRELAIRREIEIQNEMTQARLRKIIESASDMIAALDKDCRFLLFNDDYQRDFKLIFGKTICIGMSLQDAFSEAIENKENLVQTWKESLREDNTLKTVKVTVDDEERIYEISVNLIYNEKNEFNGAVQSVRNITKRVQDHIELQESYKKLEQGMEALEDKNKQITLLVEMSDIMLASNSQEELSEVMSKYSARLLNFASGYLYVMHPSKNYLEIISRWGEPTSQDTTFVPEQCWAIRLGRKHHVSSSNRSELICSHIKISNPEQNAFLCVPLMAQNDIYGLLYLELVRNGADILDENHKLLINAFAELAALALANVRLRENLRYQSIRDPLTGLYNRRYLEDFLFKHVHQAERAKTTFSVLMLDLDHFKKINDSYGHDAGDAVLKELGRILQGIIRIGDIAARYGGEEFVVAFYDIDHKTTLTRAESIRQAVLRLQVRYGAQQVGPITVSIGVAMYPGDGRTPTELVEAADKALYTAKHNGRNQIISFAEINKES